MDDGNVEILLVEDNPKDLELTLHALKKNNLANEIHVARDGAEALDFFFGPNAHGRSNKPRLILMDLKLPKVSGIEVLKQLKSNSETKSIPIVVLTSSTTEKDIAECYEFGANSYLRKPIDFNSFVESAKTIGLYWLLMNKIPP